VVNILLHKNEILGFERFHSIKKIILLDQIFIDVNRIEYLEDVEKYYDIFKNTTTILGYKYTINWIGEN
jgi:hypothetical protein